MRGDSYQSPRIGSISNRSSLALVHFGHHVLDVRVVLERIRAQVLAVARLLVAAMRHLADERNVVVDPDRSELELPSGVQRPTDVARPHGSCKSIVDVVGPRDRLVVVREPLHGDDRAEDLALDDLVLLTDAGDHGRLDEEPTGAVRLATRQDTGAFRALEEPEDALLLVLRDHRTHVELLAL